MFELKVKKAVVFKRVVDAVKDMVTDANFRLTNSGISIQAVDTSHISLCDLQLCTGFFETYKCDQPAVLGINIPNMVQVLKCAGSDDSITFTSSNDSSLLNILFESSTGDKRINFEMKLLEIEDEDMQKPDDYPEATFLMKSAEFNRIIRDISDIGDICKIYIKDDKIGFSVDGDIGKIDITCDVEMVDKGTSLEVGFSLKYLKYMTSAAHLSPKVNITLCKDLPIGVQFIFEGETGSLTYYLAPSYDD
jgi:proliferating cell nuclear antigen